MNTSKNIFNKENKTLIAIAHVAWVMIMSLVIIVLMTELFQGSNFGKLMIILLIASYIIFSFARKFWTEKKQKKLLDAIDITMTLVGGLFLVMAGCVDCSNVGDLAGRATGNPVSQPHMTIFYLGIFLLVVGAIRIYIINKLHSK